ncbi:hypothetical protein ACA910_008968 [Epithemia clementina (nom. ined.)]
MVSPDKQNAKQALEGVVSGLKVKQQQQLQRPAEPETEQQEEEQPGSVKPKRYLPPQATPNMNAEAAHAAAIQYKKKEKRIRKAVAKLEGGETEKSCCVIL